MLKNDCSKKETATKLKKLILDILYPNNIEKILE